MPIGLKSGTVALFPHEKAWEKAAADCIEMLKSVLGEDAVDIQHVGSTAIYGIPAKPIIDIAIQVKCFADIQKHDAELLEKGVVYRNSDVPWQLLYVMGDFEKDTRTHHIHVVKTGSESWDDYLNFRDYLNTHPADSQAYAELKCALMERFSEERKAYTAGKQAFIDEILDKAGAWREEGANK